MAASSRVETLDAGTSQEAGPERRSRYGRFAPLVHRLATSMVPPEPVLSAIKPPMSRQAWLRFLLTHLPILQWTWTYRLQYLLPDIISGLTVGVVHIPLGLAYGLLTGLDPVYGLYTSFVPVIMYSIFGTSRQLSTGTFAVISLMVANGINQVFSDNGLDMCLDETNVYWVINWTNTTCGQMEVEVAVSLAITSGIIMTVMGCFQMGFITIFLSEPLISGYTTGAALLVVTTQVPHMLGTYIKLKPIVTYFPDVFSLPRTWVEVFRRIFHWPQYINTATFVISLCSLVLMALLGLVNQKLVSRLNVRCCAYSQELRCHATKRRFNWPVLIPIPLVLVIISTVFSVGINFDERFNVTVVGVIPASLPPLSVPSGQYMMVTITNAFAIAIVTCAINMSLVQLYAKKHNYTTNSNQELIAYGVANIVGSFFSSFSSVASLARTAIQNDSDGKTQLVGLISSTVVGIVLVSLGFLFYSLPKAVLAAIICGSILGMFKQVRDLKKYSRLSSGDTLVWLVVFFASLILGMDLGLALGILFSLLVLVFKAALPHINASRPTDEDWRYGACNEKDVVVFRFDAPLCFVNIGVFRTRLIMAAHLDKEPLKSDGGCIQTLVHKLQPYRGLQNYDEDASSEILGHREDSSPLSTVVIDCASIGYLDTVGIQTLLQVITDFDLKGIQVLLASLSVQNLRMLQRSNFSSLCGIEWIFPTVHDAVQHSLNGKWLRPHSLQASAKPNMIEMEKLPERSEDGESAKKCDSAVGDDGAVSVGLNNKAGNGKDHATTL